MDANLEHLTLKERRAITNFIENNYPALLADIQEAAGSQVHVEVEWGSVAAKDWSHMYEESIPKIYFIPITKALKRIGVDEMGRKALKDSLKKIVVKNSDQYSGPQGFSFQEGTLIIDHNFSNADYINERVDHLVKIIEEGL